VVVSVSRTRSHSFAARVAEAKPFGVGLTSAFGQLAADGDFFALQFGPLIPESMSGGGWEVAVRGPTG
jgi:hypothetical protein